ncbi:hypothetical protein [Thioflavicoccus mobilis]|uniref:hypothetical protein n=1 Tax=Thioflavicoccus mobilis TaxID=80679 RepID=UPI0012F98642|nr:hypothetical protein [Thioflavicoccus mobilis]
MRPSATEDKHPARDSATDEASTRRDPSPGIAEATPVTAFLADPGVVRAHDRLVAAERSPYRPKMTD